MIRKWEQGADVVYAMPEHPSKSHTDDRDGHTIAKQRSIFKIYSSSIYRLIINRMEESGQTYVSTDFRLLDREVAEVIQIPDMTDL